MELINWISLGGVALIIAAYIAVSTKRLPGDSLRYQLMNFVGALMVLAEVLQVRAWGSVTINFVWAAIALVMMVKIRRRRKKQIL